MILHFTRPLVSGWLKSKFNISAPLTSEFSDIIWAVGKYGDLGPEDHSNLRGWRAVNWTHPTNRPRRQGLAHTAAQCPRPQEPGPLAVQPGVRHENPPSPLAMAFRDDSVAHRDRLMAQELLCLSVASRVCAWQTVVVVRCFVVPMLASRDLCRLSLTNTGKGDSCWYSHRCHKVSCRPLLVSRGDASVTGSPPCTALVQFL